MSAGLLIARCFLIGGAVLAVLGLLLWAFLPFHLTLPPYLFTALLALGYGLFCRHRSRGGRIETRE